MWRDPRCNWIQSGTPGGGSTPRGRDSVVTTFLACITRLPLSRCGTFDMRTPYIAMVSQRAISEAIYLLA